MLEDLSQETGAISESFTAIVEGGYTTNGCEAAIAS